MNTHKELRIKRRKKAKALKKKLLDDKNNKPKRVTEGHVTPMSTTVFPHAEYMAIKQIQIVHTRRLIKDK